MVRADLGEHLGHVRVDVPVAERVRHRHAVMAVLDEVHVADPVDVDRRHRLAPALREVDALPALAHARRGGPERRGRTRASGRRSRRSSRAGSSARRAAARRSGRGRWTTSSNGRMWFTSSARRSRADRRASARRRRARLKSYCASALGRPVSLGISVSVLQGGARAVVFAALSAAMAVTRARTVRPRSQVAPHRPRHPHGQRACIRSRAGSRAAARRRVSPISTVTPTRQSLSGQRALRVMPPVVSGCCVVAIRARRRGAAVSLVLWRGALARRSGRAPRRGGSGSGSGTGGPGRSTSAIQLPYAVGIVGRIRTPLGHAPLAHEHRGVGEPPHLEVGVAREAAVVARVERAAHAEVAGEAAPAEVLQAALGRGRPSRAARAGARDRPRRAPSSGRCAPSRRRRPG